MENQAINSDYSLYLLFLACEDTRSLKLPVTYSDDEMVGILDADIVSDYHKYSAILNAWFFERYLKDQYGRLWDLFEHTARMLTENKQDQSLYGSICRESFNHSWSVQSMLALGLFDLPLTSGASLMQFNKDEFESQMNTIWLFEEPEAFG